MHPRDVDQVLGRLSSLRFLVLGDLMLDEYILGKTERISPEAPVQIVEVTGEEMRLGGAGNVLNNLATLGIRCSVVSVVGEDADGERIAALLEERGVDVAGLLRCKSRPTTRKTRVLASHQQMMRIDREHRSPLSPSLEEALLEKFEASLQGADAVLVSDYLKGVLTPAVLSRVVALGREHGIPVLVDPKGQDFSKYRGATLLTPNRKEARLATGMTGGDDESLRRIGRKLVESLELDALALTRSEEGMTLFRRTGEETHLPTEAREVFDVSGAGDTVLTFLGIGLASGLSLENAGQLANVAAGIVVGKLGTSTVEYEELRAALTPHPASSPKILSPQGARAALEADRKRGARIVFTNGCFDLLHVGHVKYLQKARALGDRLVLGLNSDASIRRLKGPSRPLIAQEERAHILAALDCIDYLVLFDEDTPLSLIELLQPDILVKGGDYSVENVVGREVVEARGGHVELIEFVDGKSTTRIIDQILSRYADGGGEG